MGATHFNEVALTAAFDVGLLYAVTLPSGADANTDVTVEHGVRVIDAWVVMKGAGTSGSDVTLKNGTTNAITDTIDVSAAGDKDIVRVSEIDDAYHEIAASGTLRISTTSTGGDFPGAEAYVLGVRV